jgi:hypothetical protein
MKRPKIALLDRGPSDCVVLSTSPAPSQRGSSPPHEAMSASTSALKLCQRFDRKPRMYNKPLSGLTCVGHPLHGRS